MNEETKETVEFAIGKIQEAALALEPGAKHVYEVLVRQAWAEGVAGLMLCAAWLLVLGAYCYFAPRLVAAYRDSSFDEEFVYGLLLTTGGIASVIALTAACTQGADAALHLLNPEYYAIKDILGGLR